MRKYLIIICIPLLFTSCNKKEDVALAVRGTFGDSTPFELGYILDFIVEEIISGELNALEIKPDENILKLVFPPVETPELYVNVTPDVGQDSFIIEFTNPGKSLEEVELFSPNPGSGMGEYLPPGMIMEDETYYLISKIEGIDS